MIPSRIDDHVFLVRHVTIDAQRSGVTSGVEMMLAGVIAAFGMTLHAYAIAGLTQFETVRFVTVAPFQVTIAKY